MNRIARLTACAALVLAVSPSISWAQARDSLRLVGSSTVYPFASAVAEHFGKGGKFKTPVVESTGTGGGFKLFCSGVAIDTPDINDASRPMTDSEKKTCASNNVGKVQELRIGLDGIVVAQAKASKPFDLTLDQLYRAVAKTVPVSGKLVANPYKNWSDIDPALPKRPISILGPGVNHGTRDAFVELVMAPACEKSPLIKALPAADAKKACATVREDGAWIDVSEDYAMIMGKLKNDKNAVGVFTYSYIDQNKDKIQASKIEGVAATLDTIASGDYPMSRPLFIYVKTAHIGSVPGLAEFVQEFVSDKAAGNEGYLVDKGLIAAPAKILKAQQLLAKSLK
jgi:phosphate transport system substrate-binding protein